MIADPLLEDLPSRLDHTILRPDATKADVLRLCEEARQYGFGVIFVPPCYVEDAVAAVAGAGIEVGIPIGFPLGNQTTSSKVAEAIEAVARGAGELDMVLNVSRLKSGDADYVLRDMVDVVRATPGIGHKVILETCFLSREEKVLACRLAVEAGMDYVKTLHRIRPGRCSGRGCAVDEGHGRRSREGESIRRNPRSEDRARAA